MQTNFEYHHRYFGDDGKAVTNQWVQFGDKWRYYNDDGAYYVGYFYFIDDDELYAFDEDGYAFTGWHDLYDSWYYFSEKGMRLKNQWVDGDQYYVDSNGVMLTNTWIDNSNYVGADGKKTVNTWEEVMVNGNINWVMVLMLLKEWFYIMVSIMQLIMMDIWLQMVRPMLATTM